MIHKLGSHLGFSNEIHSFHFPAWIQISPPYFTSSMECNFVVSWCFKAVEVLLCSFDISLNYKRIFPHLKQIWYTLAWILKSTSNVIKCDCKVQEGRFFRKHTRVFTLLVQLNMEIKKRNRKVPACSRIYWYTSTMR